jgi:putative endopeptidase
MVGLKRAALLGSVFAMAFSASAADWGFNTANEDQKVGAGNDFFRYANGAWLDSHEIPGDKTGVSRRLEMTDRTEERLHKLMEDASSKPNGDPNAIATKVGAFYKSFMDEKRIDLVGIRPLQNELAWPKAAKFTTTLVGLMGRSTVDFDPTLFAVSIDVDVKDPDHYAVYLNQSGLGLPDRDFYLEPGFAKQREAYQAYAAKMLKLLGWANPDVEAKNILALETAIAKASWTAVQQRDINALYNPMSIPELQKLTPRFDWATYLDKAGLATVKRVVVGEKSAFPKIWAAYNSTPLETLQAWHAFRIIDNAAPYLPKEYQDAWFELHGKALAGQKEQKARWKRGILAVSGGDCGADARDCFGTLDWGVGQLYSAAYFPAETKAKIGDLVLNLKAAYRARLEKLDWMSDKTKTEALAKLDSYTIKVGYPDHPRDYSKVSIHDDDLIGNVRHAAYADWQFQLDRLNGPVDKSDWIMTPQTNDAYNGALRDIVFPAAILQSPMFDANADPAINYGAIGAVIGHELTHGFDDQGRKLDAKGALRDWWQPADAKQFDARAAKLGKQYSAFEPIPGVHVNGNLSMGENIADLGGLTIALDAYHASLHGQPAPVIDGITGDQRVFLGWAQAWCGKVTEDYVKKQVVSDPHSPRQFRVNGVVRNIDAWYDAFGVKPGDKLYVAPADRVRIW